MYQKTPPIDIADDPLEIFFETPDFDSPLLTASLVGEVTEEGAYLLSEISGFLIGEEKVRGRWGKRQETNAEREARIEAQRAKAEETHQKIEAGLQELSSSLSQGKSEQLLKLLDAVACFHQYSLSNTFLISIQRPDATMVAGFHTWKALGRFVKAGEKGIAILAPIPKRVKVEVETERHQENEESHTTTKTLTASGVWGFKVVFVFDVSQTDGEPLPQPATVTGDPAHALARLKEQIKGAGIQLTYCEDLNGSFGRSRGGAIQMKIGLHPGQEFSTLVHEFAHELLHPLTERQAIPKRVKETEAEAVAYVVSRAIGLNTGTAASDYIQIYRGDTQTLTASLERIQKTATQILSKLEEPGTHNAQL